MATGLLIHDDLDISASPPGRESRDDWRSGDSQNDERKTRSRSRSPVRRPKRGVYPSPTREMRYSRDGTNTTSNEPHLERARLFVGNIEPNHTHRRDLIKFFSQYGDVLGVSVHKGYAFVQMDREKTANKAINCEDNQHFMGSKIHVEFSQAALKAGAKFQRLAPRSPPPPPVPRERSVSARMHDPYPLDDQEKQREERLARILQMEREIAMLRSNQDSPASYDSRKPRVSGDSYDRRERDSYDRRDEYRRSPPMPRGYDSYSRDREPSYRGSSSDRGSGVSNGRGYYNRQSPSRDLARGSDGYRDQVSYPAHFNSGTSNYNRNSPTVGYGSVGGSGSLGKSSAPTPPGWPPGSQDKSNPNRPPFTNTGPWS